MRVSIILSHLPVWKRVSILLLLQPLLWIFLGVASSSAHLLNGRLFCLQPPCSHSPVTHDSHLSLDYFMCTSNLCSLAVHRHLKSSKSLTEFITCNHVPAQKIRSLSVSPLASSIPQAIGQGPFSALSPLGSQPSYKSYKFYLLNITQNYQYVSPLVLGHRPSARPL